MRVERCGVRDVEGGVRGGNVLRVLQDISQVILGQKSRQLWVLFMVFFPGLALFL